MRYTCTGWFVARSGEYAYFSCKLDYLNLLTYVYLPWYFLGTQFVDFLCHICSNVLKIVFLRSRNLDDINIKQQTSQANYSYVVVFNLFPNIMCTQTLYLCLNLFLFNCKKKVSIVCIYCAVILKNQFHQSKLMA